jgi:hypothetical protein
LIVPAILNVSHIGVDPSVWGDVRAHLSGICHVAEEEPKNSWRLVKEKHIADKPEGCKGCTAIHPMAEARDEPGKAGYDADSSHATANHPQKTLGSVQ